MFAAANGHDAIVTLLLGAGADPNLKDSPVRTCTGYGVWTRDAHVGQWAIPPDWIKPQSPSRRLHVPGYTSTKLLPPEPPTFDLSQFNYNALKKAQMFKKESCIPILKPVTTLEDYNTMYDKK